MTASLPSSTQWNAGLQMMLPWNTSLDVEYVGQHSYHTLEGVDINSVDFGSALPDVRTRIRRWRQRDVPGATAVSTDRMRAYPWIRRHQPAARARLSDLPFAPVVVPAPVQQRRSRSGSTTRSGCLTDSNTDARIQHNADGTWSYRADQAQADELLGNNNPGSPHDEGELRVGSAGPEVQTVGAAGDRLRRQRLAAVRHLDRGDRRRVHGRLQLRQQRRRHMNLTGTRTMARASCSLAIRARGAAATSTASSTRRHSRDRRYSSVGLESGNGYLRGCFSSVLDLAVARNIRLGGNRNLQLRVDMFNAPNAAASPDGTRR